MFKFIVGLLILNLCGCASVTYRTVGGESFTYSRFGAQSIQGLSFVRDEQGLMTVTLEKNRADAGDLGKAVADLAEVASKMSAQ